MNQLAVTLCILMEAILTMKAENVREPPLNDNQSQTKEKVAVLGIAQYPPKLLYKYSYITDTGIQAYEKSTFYHFLIPKFYNESRDIKILTESKSVEVIGNYSYTDAEDNTFQVSYVANEYGFYPQGAHLPTVPPLIKKALQYIDEHPEESLKK